MKGGERLKNHLLLELPVVFGFASTTDNKYGRIHPLSVETNEILVSYDVNVLTRHLDVR